MVTTAKSKSKNNEISDIKHQKPTTSKAENQLVSVAVNNLGRWALNWAVTTCEKKEFNPDDISWDPSNNWAQGTDIINRAGIISKFSEGEWHCEGCTGNTSVISGLRCFVFRHLGGHIEVPLSIMGLDDVRRKRNRP